MPATDNKGSFDKTQDSVHEVVSKQARDYIYEINTQRLNRAKELNLNLGAISISEETSMILFHGVTDEEMDGKDNRRKLETISMWKSWLDDQEEIYPDKETNAIPFMALHDRIPFKTRTSLLQVAQGISWAMDDKIPGGNITALVRNAHYDFVRISYPLQVILRLLDDNTWPNYLKEPDLAIHRTDWLKGRENEGRITVDMIREALEGLRPLEDHDVDDWKDLKVTPAITALDRFIQSGRNVDRRKALSRVMGIIEENKYNIYAEPDIIRQHFETKLSLAEQAEYWARLIKRFKARFGEYVELADNHLLSPGFEIQREIEAARGTVDGDDHGTPQRLADDDNQSEPGPPTQKRRIDDLKDDDDPSTYASSAYYAFGFNLED